MENLNYIDVALLGIILISALIGIIRGLMREILSLFAWIFSIYIAWLFADRVASDYISRFIDDRAIAYLAAFGLLFLVGLFLIGLLNLLVAQILKSTGLGGFDRMLGMLFGLLRGIVITTLLVFFAQFTPATQLAWWQTSSVIPGFVSLGSWGWRQLPSDVRQWFQQGGRQVISVSDILQQAAVAAPKQTTALNPPSVVAQQTTAPTPPTSTTPSQAQPTAAPITLESLTTTPEAGTPAKPSTNKSAQEQPTPIIKLESIQ